MLPLRRSIVRLLALVAMMSVSLGAILSADHWGTFPIRTAISAMYGLSIGLPATLLFRRMRPRLARLPQLRQWLAYLGMLMAITVVATVAIRGCMVALGLITLDQMWQGMVASFEISAAIAIPSMIGAATFSRMQRQLDDTEIREAEARIASLESRIRPHFLFNALNSAIALIPEDPKRAENVLERLSALLRFSLDAHTKLVPLREELRVVADYLEIERVRFGERLAYELDVPPELEAIEVPAFAIQTLVENSVKYAVSPRKQGARIVVRARRAGGRLVLEITDDGPGFTGNIWIAGHGLDGLRARLAALYGHAARMSASTPGGGAAVTIEVPAEASR